MQPTVSVLIPTYNYAQFLGEAIDSVLAQTFQDFEIVIVDNHSTDNTEAFIQKYLTDKRIIYHKNETNIGIIGNFNRCLEYGTGKYIKFLMADDLFHPQLLEKFVKVMEDYPSVTLVTSYNEMFGVNNKRRQVEFANLQSGKKIIYECLLNGRGNCIGEPTSVMFKKETVDGLRFNPAYSALVDLNLWLRLLTKGDCYFVPEVLSYFRIHGSQATSVNSLKNRFDEYFFYKTIKTNNEYNADLSGIDLDNIIKSKATKSTKAMFKVAPGILKKSNREVFYKALKIGLKEHVVFKSLFSRLSKGL